MVVKHVDVRGKSSSIFGFQLLLPLYEKLFKQCSGGYLAALKDGELVDDKGFIAEFPGEECIAGVPEIKPFNGTFTLENVHMHKVDLNTEQDTRYTTTILI